jgi:FixJ family two-component response regulator
MKTPKPVSNVHKKKVFIVDDHAILREGLSRLINSPGRD